MLNPRFYHGADEGNGIRAAAKVTALVHCVEKETKTTRACAELCRSFYSLWKAAFAGFKRLTGLRSDHGILLRDRDDLRRMRVRVIEGISEGSRKNGSQQVDINVQLAMRVQAKNV